MTVQMLEMHAIEPFAEYGALLDAQISLHIGLQQARSDAEAASWRQDIARTQEDITTVAALPGLTDSALRHGAALAQEAEGILHGQGIDAESHEGYVRRLRQATVFILERANDNPDLATDPRLHDIQTVLGALIADTTVTPPSMASASESAGAADQPVDYEMALHNLRVQLSALSAGDHFTLTPAQVVTLAGPNMAFSRWQRYRMLRMAQQNLMAEGYVVSHNGRRGKHSAYTLGVPAQHHTAYTLPIAV